jgi:hypothetical protein
MLGASVYALGLTIILNFRLSALLGSNWIPVLLEKWPDAQESVSNCPLTAFASECA